MPCSASPGPCAEHIMIDDTPPDGACHTGHIIPPSRIWATRLSTVWHPGRALWAGAQSPRRDSGEHRCGVPAL